MIFQVKEQEILNEALRARILSDPDFVIKGLESVGLKTENLLSAARSMIIEDFRKTCSTPKVDPQSHDISGTFTPFVNEHGNYCRRVSGHGAFILVPGSDKSFRTIEEKQNPSDVTTCEKVFNQYGCELKRNNVVEVTTGANKPTTTLSYTRDPECPEIVHCVNGDGTKEDYYVQIGSGRQAGLDLDVSVRCSTDPSKHQTIIDILESQTNLEFYAKKSDSPKRDDGDGQFQEQAPIVVRQEEEQEQEEGLEMWL